MRDTGSTLTIVQDKFIKRDDYTGNKISVLLANRCVRYLPEAVVHIQSPCYKGKISVLAMSDPVYPLIIGNNICQDLESPSAQDQDEYDMVDCSKPVRGTVIFENSSQIDPKVRLDSSSTVSQSDNTVVKTVIDSATDKPACCVTDGNNLNSQKITSAFETRAQIRVKSRGLKPLNHTVIDALSLTKDEFTALQREDLS